jgi:hypothetical protein
VDEAGVDEGRQIELSPYQSRVHDSCVCCDFGTSLHSQVPLFILPACLPGKVRKGKVRDHNVTCMAYRR